MEVMRMLLFFCVCVVIVVGQVRLVVGSSNHRSANNIVWEFRFDCSLLCLSANGPQKGQGRRRWPTNPF